MYFKLNFAQTSSLDVRMRLLDEHNGHIRKWAELNMDGLRVLLNECVRHETWLGLFHVEIKKKKKEKRNNNYTANN